MTGSLVMKPYLALVSAVEGIANGLGAFWTAKVASRQLKPLQKQRVFPGL
jgi:hypothetical protein